LKNEQTETSLYTMFIDDMYKIQDTFYLYLLQLRLSLQPFHNGVVLLSDSDDGDAVG